MQPPQGPYNPTAPQYPASAPPEGGVQWVQRPLPGQNPYPGYGAGGYPGQVPPPAQIAPDAQTPYGYTPGQVPPPAQIAPDAQTPYGYTSGAAPVGWTDQAAQSPQPAPEAEEEPQTVRVSRNTGSPGYSVPKTGMPHYHPPRRRWPYFVLAAIALAVGGFLLFRSMTPGQAAYGYVKLGSLSAMYAGDAVLVRNETVFSQEGVSQIVLEADEGSAVKRGDIVATIYTSGFSSREWTTLQNYRNQIKEYHKKLISDASADTRMLSLTTQVRERALEAQQLVQGARGSLSGQETLLSDAMQSLRTYIKQKYPDDQKLSRLYDEENTQLQRISTWSKQYAAVNDGLVSFYTDGFESALNMSNYAEYTPAEVRSMYNGQVPRQGGQTVSRNSTDIYRLVRQEGWAVLLLCGDQDWAPITGRTYQMLIEDFTNIVVSATVESFTRSGGELLVRLTVDNPSVLPNVLYIRSCKVQVGESVNTLSVPSRAIYVQNGRKGVVIATEGGEYWTGVEVVSDDGVNAYVIPENYGILYNGAPVRLF